MNYKTIIWDWNGTLLNDIDICIEGMNVLLKERSMPILDRARYQEVFDFPVSKYYENIGFDFSKEVFEGPALQFINEYIKRIKNSDLHSHSVPCLKTFKENGMRQIILSAMKHSSLVKSVDHLGITGYFESINGIADDFAHSKTDLGKRIFKEQNIEPESTLMIGDTLHDYETAQVLGIDCVLIADGHQSAERLAKTGTLVYENLSEFLSQNELFAKSCAEKTI